MKALIFSSILVTLACASLEPSGYRPPNSGIPLNRYLSSRNDGLSTVLTPESHYLPTNYQNSTSPNAILNSQYLPSNHDSVSPHHAPVVVAMPSIQYLPTVPNQVPHSRVLSPTISTHYHHDHDTIQAVEIPLTSQHVPSSSTPVVAPSASLHTIKPDIVSSRYLPPSQRPGTFTQAIASSNYLPVNQNQYSNDIDQSSTSVKLPPANIYLMSSKFSNAFSGLRMGAHNHFDGYSNANGIDQLGDSYDSVNVGYSKGLPGYNNRPDIAKYEFEYVVKDEIGNDYSHKENRNGDDTQGIYTVLLPDGRKQIVHYVANGDGYKPSITYEDSKSSQSGFDQGYKY